MCQGAQNQLGREASFWSGYAAGQGAQTAWCADWPPGEANHAIPRQGLLQVCRRSTIGQRRTLCAPKGTCGIRHRRQPAQRKYVGSGNRTQIPRCCDAQARESRHRRQDTPTTKGITNSATPHQGPHSESSRWNSPTHLQRHPSGKLRCGRTPSSAGVSGASSTECRGFGW